MNKWILVLMIGTIAVLFVGCQVNQHLPPVQWEQIPVTHYEKEKWFEILPKLDGIPYKFGGQSPEEGFDCSGLIVYLYNQVGIRWFRYKDNLVTDVTSEDLYLYNSTPTSWEKLKHGDFIFFDSDDDSQMEHVVIFGCVENGNIWIWDATTNPDGVEINAVSHRILKNMWNKNPFFAIPLKVVSGK